MSVQGLLHKMAQIRYEKIFVEDIRKYETAQIKLSVILFIPKVN